MTAPSSLKAIWASALLLTLAAFAPYLEAQAHRDCDATLVIGAGQPTGNPRHPNDRLARQRPMLDGRQYRQAVAQLLGEFANDPGLAADDPRRRALASRLAALRDAFGDNLDAAAYVAGAGDPNAEFMIAANPTTGAFELFPDDDDRIAVTDQTPEAERRAICWTAISAQRMLSFVRFPAFASAVQIMRNTRRQWRNHQDMGYSMYPWESLLFALPGVKNCVNTNLGPPRCAPIFLHANGGMEVSGLGKPGDDGWTDLRSRAGIAWDLVGFVAYGRDWRRYWGLALVLVTGADQTPAIGPAIHFGRSVEVGAVFRGGGASGPRRSMILSVDAYQALAGLPGRFAGARDRVEQALEKAMSPTDP